MRSKAFRRWALFLLLLPFVYFGGASATFLFRVHAENSAGNRARLSLCPSPSSQQRLLIFSPHPDDETLGCAGLMQQAERSGAQVRVAFLTNGDGFRVAVERQFRKAHVGPQDYTRFAALRQKEVRKALGNLGVSSGDILFLGYPDRGLLHLWEENWSPDSRYVSPFTRASVSPYDVVYSPGAAYCGEGVLADVRKVMRETQPTDLYVTHPSDDHPDHTAASAFVQLALMQARQDGEVWARNCSLHFFLVHRGDWPVPQGLDTDSPLGPPSDMVSLDTRWRSMPLSEHDEAGKQRSIMAYKTQTAIMKRFLVSFVRSSEIFGDLPTARVPRLGGEPITAIPPNVSWPAGAAVVQDPVNDNLLRDFQACADVKAVYACRNATTLFLRVRTAQPLKGRVDLKMSIRYFGDDNRGQAGGTFTVDVRTPRAVTPGDLAATISGDHVDVAVPMRDIAYARQIALNVETRCAGIQVDRTGYRFLDL